MKPRSVPFFNYPALFAARSTDIMQTVERVFAAGKLILQEDVERFEAELSRFLGVNHAIGVANGTESITMPLIACRVGEGDEVILPSHTFIATAGAVHAARATPVVVDCRDDHMMDPGALRKAITSRTRAVVPVQLNGRTCEMDSIMAIASEHDLVVVEDAAQALGSKFADKYAGTFGRAGSFSFYPAKLLGCFGDGGAVVTNDDEIAATVRSLRDHGRGDSGLIERWGFNSRLDNVQAALLSLKFASFMSDVERRRTIARRYDEALRGIPSLLLPPAPDADPRHFDVYQNYEIEAERRDELRAHLKEAGVGTIIQWGGHAVHQFPALGLHVSLPITERVMSKSLLLPMHAALSDEDVQWVCERVSEFFGVHV